MSTAIVAFVKTPGVSPVKTRLAATIGRNAAEQFYCASVSAVESVMQQAEMPGRCQAYWAVAAPQGLQHPMWARFPKITQGSGGLGERLHGVLNQLHLSHDKVIAIGADSPQITAATLRRAESLLCVAARQPARVMGRCPDGGFYLLAANTQTPAAVWEQVPFSAPNTAAELARLLTPLGRLHELPPLVDVDRRADLAQLCKELGALENPTSAQRAVLAVADQLQRSG